LLLLLFIEKQEEDISKMDYPKDYTMMAHQITSFYKSTTNNFIKAMTIIQEDTEKRVSRALEQSPWIPEESKKFVNDWVKAYKKGNEDLKTAVDEQFKKFEAFVNLQKRADAEEEVEAEEAAKMKVEAEKAAKMKVEAEKAAKMKVEAEKAAKMKVEAEKVAKMKVEAEEAAKMKVEAEKAAKMKVEAEKAAKVKAK
jgi:membrane protein involved in colicin uptake